MSDYGFPAPPKQRNTGLIVVIVVLAVAVLGLGGFILADRLGAFDGEAAAPTLSESDIKFLSIAQAQPSGFSDAELIKMAKETCEFLDMQNILDEPSQDAEFLAMGLAEASGIKNSPTFVAAAEIAYCPEQSSTPLN